MNIFTFLLFLYTLIYDLLKDNLTVAIGGDDYRFISLLFKQDWDLFVKTVLANMVAQLWYPAQTQYIKEWGGSNE